VLGILSLVEVNEIELVSSEMLLFEINRNSNRIRKEYALEVTSKARHFSTVTVKMEMRSREFNKLGIQPFDSVLLASAGGAHADYFCTCDDELMKKAKKIKDLKMKAVSPLELVKEILK
jgi:predicted nucleic acid-binding protein